MLNLPCGTKSNYAIHKIMSEQLYLKWNRSVVCFVYSLLIFQLIHYRSLVSVSGFLSTIRRCPAQNAVFVRFAALLDAIGHTVWPNKRRRRVLKMYILNSCVVDIFALDATFSKTAIMNLHTSRNSVTWRSNSSRADRTL